MASGSNAPFSGDHADLENVQEEQHQTKGMTESEREVLNDQIVGVARNQFENNLAQLNYDGGLFTIYRNRNKISNTIDAAVKTGKAEISSTGFDISTATQTALFDPNISGPFLQGIDFNNSGSKMFIIDSGNGLVFQFSLSTDFDITTASQTKSFDVVPQDDGPTAIEFNDSGSKMFVCGDGGDDIIEYGLSTAFDIGTAAVNSSFSVSGQTPFPRGLGFGDSGTKMYVIDDDNTRILQYDLTTGFDISTATFSKSFDVSSQASAIKGIDLSRSGDRAYICDEGNADILQFDLSTAFDIGTAGFTQSFDVGGFTLGPETVNFNGNGSNMFVVGTSTNRAYKFELNTTVDSNSGTVIITSKDLSKAENGGFSSPPSSAVLSQSADIPTNTDISYTLRDGNGNTATVTQSNVDSVVDTSNFTSTTVELEVNLSQTGGKTPTSKDVMVHFKE